MQKDEDRKIPQLSEQLRAALGEELGKIDQKEQETQEPEVLVVEATERLLARILDGEAGLYDPTNAGDRLALSLGCG